MKKLVICVVAVICLSVLVFKMWPRSSPTITESLPCAKYLEPGEIRTQVENDLRKRYAEGEITKELYQHLMGID